MATSDHPKHPFPSTDWEWKKVKINRAPAGDSAASSEARAPSRRRKRDAHKPLTIRVRFRGGPTASWLIEYRGLTRRFEGHLALHDVMSYLSEAFWEHGFRD